MKKQILRHVIHEIPDSEYIKCPDYLKSMLLIVLDEKSAGKRPNEGFLSSTHDSVWRHATPRDKSLYIWNEIDMANEKKVSVIKLVTQITTLAS